MTIGRAAGSRNLNATRTLSLLCFSLYVTFILSDQFSSYHRKFKCHDFLPLVQEVPRKGLIPIFSSSKLKNPEEGL